MLKMKNILSPENKKLFVKYIFISLVSYGFVFTGLILLIDVFEVNKSLAFLAVYGVNYIFLYVVQLRYLFNTEHHTNKLIRFVGYILFFYLLANALYNLGLVLKINYLVSTVITIIILMPLRLLVSKKYVYKA